uniref:Uncharacterized protein n=1 Tax=Branchiostoma floridae TaxID=7739 RepID=C3ZAH3_BRAFL|eukprot:XP_002594365.1 hypothetical protein BRAFLDRAFT_72226 [Branchiostoma floridae]
MAIQTSSTSTPPQDFYLVNARGGPALVEECRVVLDRNHMLHTVNKGAFHIILARWVCMGGLGSESDSRTGKPLNGETVFWIRSKVRKSCSKAFVKKGCNFHIPRFKKSFMLNRPSAALEHSQGHSSC